MNTFVNEEYRNYNKLVGVGDNYIILTNKTSAENEQISIIYQYIKPSTMVIEGTRNVYGYTEYKRIETTDNFWARGDAPEIVIAGIVTMFLLLFIINGVTKLVKKGGIFFGQ